ncbi:hypothetical protein ACOME3_004994 [Neoechinorhynchus agilis]
MPSIIRIFFCAALALNIAGYKRRTFVSLFNCSPISKMERNISRISNRTRTANRHDFNCLNSDIRTLNISPHKIYVGQNGATKNQRLRYKPSTGLHVYKNRELMRKKFLFNQRMSRRVKRLRKRGQILEVILTVPVGKIFRWKVPLSLFAPGTKRSGTNKDTISRLDFQFKPNSVFYIRNGMLIGLPLTDEQGLVQVLRLEKPLSKQSLDLRIEFGSMGLRLSSIRSDPVFVVEFNSSYALNTAQARVRIAQKIAEVFQLNASDLIVHSVLPPSVRWSAPVRSIDLNRIFYQKLKTNGLQGTKGIVSFRTIGQPSDLLPGNFNVAAAMALLILVIGVLLTIIIGICIYLYGDMEADRIRSQLDQRIWMAGSRGSKTKLKKKGVPVILCEELEDAPLQSRSPVLLRFERPPIDVKSPTPPANGRNLLQGSSRFPV